MKPPTDPRFNDDWPSPLVVMQTDKRTDYPPDDATAHTDYMAFMAYQAGRESVAPTAFMGRITP